MGSVPSEHSPASRPAGFSFLQEGWVIANHILVSFHAAFISSVLAIPGDAASRAEVLRFIFLSPETLVSAVFTYLVFHTAISLHELGHFLEAARLRALNDSIQVDVEARLAQVPLARLAYLVGMFLRIPYGLAVGVKREDPETNPVLIGDRGQKIKHFVIFIYRILQVLAGTELS